MGAGNGGEGEGRAAIDAGEILGGGTVRDGYSSHYDPLRYDPRADGCDLARLVPGAGVRARGAAQQFERAKPGPRANLYGATGGCGVGWTVPRCFEGATVVVLGSGPSLNARDVAKVRDLPTIAVNDAHLLAPWAWMLYAADWRYWGRSPSARKFAGLKVSVEAYLPEVLRLRNTGIDGFDADPSCIRTGNNSGYQGLHIAIHTGAARVLLLGFDMKGGHFNGRPDGPLRRDWLPRFAALEFLMRGRVEIINCTPQSALACFPARMLDEALGGN
jgi:hypothetical protein